MLRNRNRNLGMLKKQGLDWEKNGALQKRTLMLQKMTFTTLGEFIKGRIFSFSARGMCAQSLVFQQFWTGTHW